MKKFMERFYLSIVAGKSKRANPIGNSISSGFILCPRVSYPQSEGDVNWERYSSFILSVLNRTYLFQSQRKPNHTVLSHRRTESYDESSQRYRVQIPIYSVIDRDSEGSSSTRTTGGSSSVHSNASTNNNTNSNNANNNNNYGRPNCTSPFLSSAAASPRQRNRIRTNPWVGVAPPGSAPLAAPEDPAAPKNYSSQGETSSTVGSSSTLSSAGRVDVNGGGAASASGSSSPRLRIPPPPPTGDVLRIVRSGTYLASP
ncbi:unnamed protein product, partial [Nesidiocoris tenuis]